MEEEVKAKEDEEKAAEAEEVGAEEVEAGVEGLLPPRQSPPKVWRRRSRRPAGTYSQTSPLLYIYVVAEQTVHSVAS